MIMTSATANSDPVVRDPIHPLHAILLAFLFPLSLGALLSDVAYNNSYEMQWANFAAWLIAGALLGGGLALVWALAGLVRAGKRRSRRRVVYTALLLVTWVLGLFNALVHARDAYATMPSGLVLSVVATVLALITSWLGFTSRRAGAAS